jgi:hypothetical protein
MRRLETMIEGEVRIYAKNLANKLIPWKLLHRTKC